MSASETAAAYAPLVAALADDIEAEQFEQALSRLETTSPDGLAAVRALCYQMIGMTNVVALPWPYSGSLAATADDERSCQ